MTSAAYLPLVPAIEDCGPVLILDPGDGRERWALTRHNFALLCESMRRAIVAQQVEESALVLPFTQRRTACEGAVDQ